MNRDTELRKPRQRWHSLSASSIVRESESCCHWCHVCEVVMLYNLYTWQFAEGHQKYWPKQTNQCRGVFSFCDWVFSYVLKEKRNARKCFLRLHLTAEHGGYVGCSPKIAYRALRRIPSPPVIIQCRQCSELVVRDNYHQPYADEFLPGTLDI